MLFVPHGAVGYEAGKGDGATGRRGDGATGGISPLDTALAASAPDKSTGDI